MKNSVKIKDFSVVLLLTFAAFGLRLFRLDSFPVGGDEWYTVLDARTFGRSYYSVFFFAIEGIFINLAGLSEISLRLFPAICGALTVPIMFNLGKLISDKKTGLVAAALFAVSTFNIAESQEGRMYSLFGLLSALSILFFFRMSTSGNFKSLAGCTAVGLLNLLTHFNSAFLIVGQVFYAFYMQYKKIPANFRKVLLLASVFLLPAFFLALVFWRETIYFTILKIAEPVVVLRSGIRGYSFSTLFKVPFTFYNFIFGPSWSPYSWATLPFGALMVIWFLRAMRNRFFLKHILFLMVLPVALLFYVAEPLSNPGFTQLMPKHAMFVFPLWVVGVAMGACGLRPSFFKTASFIFAGACLAAMLYFYYYPGYSYYSSRYLDYSKASKKIQELASGKTLYLIDGRAEKSFMFYNRELMKDSRSVDPSGFLNEPLEDYETVALAFQDWTAYHGAGTLNASDRKNNYQKVLERLSREFTAVGGGVDYPFFYYVFRRNPPGDFTARNAGIPVEFYDLRYESLHLPAAGLYGSFHLNAEKSIWNSREFGDEKSGAVTLFWNLENSENIKTGEKVAEVEVKGAGHQAEVFQISKGVEIEDVFREAGRNRGGSASEKIAVKWTHYPFIAGSRYHYPGIYRQFPAYIYFIKLPRKWQGPLTISVRYVGKKGNLRIWGVSTALEKL